MHPFVQLNQCGDVDADILEAGVVQSHAFDGVPRLEAVDDGLVGSCEHEDEIHELATPIT